MTTSRDDIFSAHSRLLLIGSKSPCIRILVEDVETTNVGGSGASDLLYNLAGGEGGGGSEGSINFVVSDVLFLLDTFRLGHLS